MQAMKSNLNYFILGLICSSLMFTSGCSSDVEVDEDIIPEDQLIDVETEIKLDLVIGDIPPPTQLTSEIPKSGAPYNKSILNSTSKSGSYSTNYKKGMNLGVYITDLSYAAAYNQTQDAASYINVSKQLADNLGISKAIDDNLLASFEKNMNNTDSLMKIIDVVYKNADRYLRSNERVSTASLVLAGGWIEGLYISSSMIGETERNADNETLYKSIGDQKFSLKNLSDLLNQYKDEPDHQKLIESLAPVVDAFNKVPAPSKIVLYQVMAIAEKIKIVRDEVVN